MLELPQVVVAVGLTVSQFHTDPILNPVYLQLTVLTVCGVTVWVVQHSIRGRSSIINLIAFHLVVSPIPAPPTSVLRVKVSLEFIMDVADNVNSGEAVTTMNELSIIVQVSSLVANARN
jgi:hypothetical protein